MWSQEDWIQRCCSLVSLKPPRYISISRRKTYWKRKLLNNKIIVSQWTHKEKSMLRVEVNGHTCWASGLELCGNGWNFASVGNRAQRCLKEVGGRKLGLFFENKSREELPGWWKKMGTTYLLCCQDCALREAVCPERKMTYVPLCHQELSKLFLECMFSVPLQSQKPLWPL